MNFIVDLPSSAGFDSILVVVDRLTKMAHFITCNKSINAKQTALLVLQEIVRLNGIPEEIVSDKGPQFTSYFWKHLFKLLGKKIKLSSAYHSQFNGQSKWVNQVLEQYLKCTVNYHQGNWADLLPLAEFSYNNSTHSSTDTTLFFANYGFYPQFNIQSPKHSVVTSAENHAIHLQQIRVELTKELEAARERYKQNADRL
ncbi:17399_t:CDS:1 [Dentiscutata erythropus]|uniref:17399_t:CDS:1 n=1 Tax=Dentiscutata erythropus TaxID=1348616 RepID=A0A9N9EX66_9GLOM|nr:17399_t:CDS:1 [Dentiscutata erythropus]